MPAEPQRDVWLPLATRRSRDVQFGRWSVYELDALGLIRTSTPIRLPGGVASSGDTHVGKSAQLALTAGRLEQGGIDMQRLILFIAFVALTIAVASGCGPRPASCNSNEDCAADAYCDHEYNLCFQRSQADDSGVDPDPDAGALDGETDGGTADPPSMPTNLRAEARESAIVLHWDPNLEANLAGYNIYWGLTPTLELGLAKRLSPGNSYTATDLTGGVEYFFAVEVESREGQRSPVTPPVSAVPLSNACTECSAPANSSPTCNTGSCGFECHAGYFKCDGECCNWTDMDLRYFHACGVTSSGKVKCWGWNSNGQIGNGTLNDALLPKDVIGLGTVDPESSVSVGSWHSCVLRPAGTVSCWGANSHGELGNGTNTESMTAVTVSGLNDAVSLSAGDNHSCVITQAGSIRCWGLNTFGQLGNGNTTNQNTPVYVTGLASRALGVSAGNHHTCALLETGDVVCWGRNVNGELGTGATSYNSFVPIQVTGLSNVVALHNNGHTCAVTSGGTVRCWGYNYWGQLGDGTTEHSSSPVEVVGISTAVAVTASMHHTCALTDSRTALCWGENGSGQLGDHTSGNERHTPVAVSGLGGLQKIAAGAYSTCVLSAGMISCWGSNLKGQLGSGQSSSSLGPVEVVP